MKTFVILLLGLFVLHDEATARIVGKVSVGDMLLTPHQWLAFSQRKMADKSLLWPRNSNGVLEVPYKVTDDNVNIDMLQKGLKMWETQTCVKFIELALDDQSTNTFIEMKMDKNMGCQAGVGYNPGDPTVVSLVGYACDLAGVLHEVGHALGFSHEQARVDRDESIIIVKENIKPGDEEQFTKDKNDAYGIPYDFLSIMQYEGRAGAKDDKRVMLARDPRFQPIMGSAKALSFMDKKLFNIAYKCIDDWQKKCSISSNPCKNQGYLGKDCKCVCPEGSKGKVCEDFQMSYNDALLKKLSPHSLRVTKPGTIVTSPGYPDAPDNALKYVHVFEAPKCQRAVVTFNDFAVEPRDQDDNTCAFDRLEIRTDITQSEGKMYCGNEISANQQFKSDKSMLIFHFYGYDYAKEGQTNENKGYKVTFSTEKIDGCTL